MIYFKIISNVGGARSSHIEAIQRAEQSDFEDTRECIGANQEMFLAGHEAHFGPIQREARGEQVGNSMILVHTEDQLMSTGDFKIIAEEIPANYERVAELERRLENRQGRTPCFTCRYKAGAIEGDCIDIKEDLIMKRAYLFCSAGMPTSMLASKMQDIADSHDLPIEVEAFPDGKIGQIIDEKHPNVILLGPQIKCCHGEITEKYGDKGIPTQVIDQTDYGMMNGEEVLKSVIKLMKPAK